MLQIHYTGWHINNSQLHQVRNRLQLLFPGWYFPGDMATLSMVSRSQTHCPVPLPTNRLGKAGRYPDASQRCSCSLSASSVSSISNFFPAPGNSTFFANSTHKTVLINALWIQKMDSLVACPICKGTEQLLYIKLIPALTFRTGKRNTGRALSRDGKNSSKGFLDLSASILEQFSEIPSFLTLGFLQVDFKFLASPVLHFVGCISCICLQNMHEGLQLCKGIKTQPFSPLQTAFTSLMTWNFS